MRKSSFSTLIFRVRKINRDIGRNWGGFRERNTFNGFRRGFLIGRVFTQVLVILCVVDKVSSREKVEMGSSVGSVGL